MSSALFQFLLHLSNSVQQSHPGPRTEQLYQEAKSHGPGIQECWGSITVSKVWPEDCYFFWNFFETLLLRAQASSLVPWLQFSNVICFPPAQVMYLQGRARLIANPAGHCWRLACPTLRKYWANTRGENAMGWSSLVQAGIGHSLRRARPLPSGC